MYILSIGMYWDSWCILRVLVSASNLHQGIWATAGGGARAISFSNTTCEAKGNASLIIAQVECGVDLRFLVPLPRSSLFM